MKKMLLGVLLCTACPQEPRQEQAAVLEYYEGEFPVTVDYSMSFEAMVQAGHYDNMKYLYDFVTEDKFPIQGEGRVNKVLRLAHQVNFECPPTCPTGEQILWGVEDLADDPADIADLLAFGARYPDLQRQFDQILAPGSVSDEPTPKDDDDNRSMPVLYEFEKARHLNTIWWQAGWEDDDWFLVQTQ